MDTLFQNEFPRTVSFSGTEISLEDDQYKIAKEIVTWLAENPNTRAPYKRLGGYAGSGKTIILAWLMNNSHEILPQHMKTKPIAVCTFTWKASLVLQSRGVKSQSIHSIFYKPEVKDGVTVFVPRSIYEIRESYAAIIVDEASMVSRDMREDIERVGLPVLYCGDPGQLEPISSNGNERDLFMSKPEFFLSKIRRQSLDSPIIRLSMDIREGKRIPYGKYGEGIFKISSDDFNPEVLLRADQVLCGKNKTRTSINKRIRKLKGYDTAKMPYKDEMIIGLNNFPEKGAYNGQMWKVEEDYNEFSLLESNRTVMQLTEESDNQRKLIQNCWFPEDLKANSFVSQAQLNQFCRSNGIYLVDFGYCITVHKAQGSSYNKPIVIEEYLGNKDFHKRWLYTAVTRARSKLIIVS